MAAATTMDLGEWCSLLRDARMHTRTFGQARAEASTYLLWLHSLWPYLLWLYLLWRTFGQARSEAIFRDAAAAAAAAGHASPSSPSEGDMYLELPGFLQAVSAAALYRGGGGGGGGGDKLAPRTATAERGGGAAARDGAVPLPASLAELLREHLLPLGKRDGAAAF